MIINYNDAAAEEKTNLGSYYTPRKLVERVYSYVDQYIKDDTVFADTAAGNGAFVDCAPLDYKFIATDINEEAVSNLTKLRRPELSVFQNNSLWTLGRTSLDLGVDQHLILVGNPPYNDVTSKNKRSEKTEKMQISPKISSRDYGISFLRSYDALRADVVCVLHPLSYLIKETNFKQLREFSVNYKLKKACVFSSALFPDTRGTKFPIIVGLYERDAWGMDYEYIRNFRFDILESERQFMLSNVTTIDGVIRKYPPTKNDPKVSDIGLYFYSVRDSNSLISSANFSEKEKFNVQITVNFSDFYKYAYLSCYKRYMEKDYLFGNVSPLVDVEDLDDKEFQAICMIDTVLNNSKIYVFSDVEFLSRIRRKIDESIDLNNLKNKDFQEVLSLFLSGEAIDNKVFASYLENYFLELKSSML